ncbi:MAG TPA: hypothetical protein VGU63_08540 [Candidatus Acidoferrales bacterium]|nr:hypothetical protein [Candidatus Acidoferrales bacterium]
MRRIRGFLLVMFVVLLLGWARSMPAAPQAQDCCHPSAAKTNKPTPVPAAGVKAMSPVTTNEMREEFNVSSDKVRIVALLSPACPGCQSGHEVVGRILKKFSSLELHAILVWEPMRSDDSPWVATQQAEKVRDVRIWQGWNGNKNLGKLFGETLNLHDVAWDVYLLYKPGIKWEAEEPPAPTFWMHQLQGVNSKLLLCADPTRLSAEVGKLLGDSEDVPHGN